MSNSESFAQCWSVSTSSVFEVCISQLKKREAVSKWSRGQRDSVMFLSEMYSSAHNKYHGLINHGATCYLNSVLQVLFMTKDFREAVQRFTNDNPESIDRHLKDLFDNLLQRTAGTSEIMKTLQIAKAYEQRDAAEYLERILRLASPKAAEIFHGQLINTTTCSGCGAQTTSDGPFWHLPLPLVNSCSGSYSVVEGLNDFFKISDLNGENQMYCDQCDTKVDAKRKNDVTHHPEVLTVLLKRFDFSYQHMSFVKINCDVDVPYTLKLPESQEYELYAVVDHFGDLRSGHYAAAIKVQDDEDKWFYFDDTSVTQIVNQPFMDDENSVKSPSAYLLFYRRKDVGVQETMVLANGGSPVSSCENFNQSCDAETVRRTEEHGHTDVSVDTMEGALDQRAVPTDSISVSREKETSSDHNFKAHHPEVEAEQVEPKLSDCFLEGHVREQESDEGKTMRDDQQGPNDGVQAERSSLLPNEGQCEVRGPENPEPVKFEVRPDVNLDFPSVSEGSVAGTVPNKQEEISSTQKTEPEEETDENEKTERKEKLLNMDAGQHHGKESSYVGENFREYHCGNKANRVDDGFKPDANKKGEEGRMETDVRDEKEGKSDSDQVRSQKRLLTKCDLCLFGWKFDDRKQNVAENDQKHKQENHERNEKRVDTRGKDHDAEQSESGQRNRDAHEMGSTEGAEKYDKNQENEETSDTSDTQSCSEMRERPTCSQGACETTRQEISKPKARDGLQEVEDGLQNSKQPGDGCIIAEQSSESPSGGRRNETTQYTETTEGTSHATTETHEKDNGDVDRNFDKTNNTEASLSTAGNSMKVTESPSLKQQHCRGKGVTAEQMEAAGIKYSLKNRSLKRSKCWGCSRQPRLAAYRGRKRQNSRKYLGGVLSQKGRKTQVRIQRLIKKKSTPI